MTTRYRRRLAGMLRPRTPRTVVFYGVDPVVERNGVAGHFTENPSGVLDNTVGEIRPQNHREAAVDDPWLSPSKSEIVQECEIIIATARRHTLMVNGVGDNDLDLRGFCEDAKLTERQTEVVVLTGEGWSQRAIAEWLKLSQPTVWYHLRHGRSKLAGWLPLVVVMKLDAALSGSV